MNDKISIIVPVYKVENSIDRCIRSVLSQTYQDWELILVDDGSPDASGKICDEYSEKESRIKVFHIKNGGPSNARNIGLNKATGKYVCFIDSDDWADPTYLEHLYGGIQSEGVGVVVAGHVRDCGDKHVVKNVGNFYYDRTDIHKMFEARKICNWGYPHGKLYRLDIIREHKIEFPINVKFSEDLVLFLNYLKYVDWVSFISDVDYHYVYQEGGGSLISSYNSFESEFEGYRLCNQYFHELADFYNASKDEMKTSYEWMTYMFMRAIKTIYRKGKNYKGRSERLKILKSISDIEYNFANHFNASNLFIDKWTLALLRENKILLADCLLAIFFKIRYIGK